MRVFATQELQHLLRAQGCSVWLSFVDSLSDMARLLFALISLVWIVLRDVFCEEIDHVLDITLDFSTCHKP